MDTHYPRILDCCCKFGKMESRLLFFLANLKAVYKWSPARIPGWTLGYGKPCSCCSNYHRNEMISISVATTAYNTSLLGLGYFQRRFNTPTGYYWFISFPTVFMSHPKVKILGGETQVIQGLCNFIIDCSAKAIKDHGKFWVAFSGEKFIIIRLEQCSIGLNFSLVYKFLY